MKSLTGKIWRLKSSGMEGNLLHRVMKHRSLGNLQGHWEDLASPYLFKDLRKGVERVSGAILRGEKIMIFGDYDVDGVVSATILYQTLKELDGKVSVRLPNRFTHGYGLNMDFIRECRELGVGLIVTVDCGVSNFEEVELARSLGIDVVITDHHHAPAVLPRACAIVNPNQYDCSYPEKHLCGAGVIFRFCEALLQYAKRSPDFMFQFLDLAALAATADCMPVTGENRILIQKGLEKLARDPHPALNALLRETSIKDGRYTTHTFGYQLGPPLNAAGRLDHALDAFYLLNGRLELASKLARMNTERQSMLQMALAEAEAMVESSGSRQKRILIVGSDHWGLGIIGLIAGKLTEKYHMPSVALARRGDEYAASARSIRGYHITEALHRVKDHLHHFGGHAQAAGFSLAPPSLPEFIAALEADAARSISDDDLQPVLEIDTELSEHELELESADMLRVLEPHGIGNPSPLFLLKDARIMNPRLIGASQAHVSMTLAKGAASAASVAFQFSEHLEKLASSRPFDLAVSLTRNEWKGSSSLQLVVRDVREHE